MTNTATVHRRSNFKAQEVGFQRKRGTLMVSPLEYICIIVSTSSLSPSGRFLTFPKDFLTKNVCVQKTHDRYSQAVQILMHNNDIQKKHPYYLQRTLTSGFRACARGEFSHPDLCLQGEFCLVSKQSKNGFKLSILILDETFIQIPGPPWRVHRQSEVVTHIFFAFLGKTF